MPGKDFDYEVECNKCYIGIDKCLICCNNLRLEKKCPINLEGFRGVHG